MRERAARELSAAKAASVVSTLGDAGESVAASAATALAGDEQIDRAELCGGGDDAGGGGRELAEIVFGEDEDGHQRRLHSGSSAAMAAASSATEATSLPCHAVRRRGDFLDRQARGEVDAELGDRADGERLLTGLHHHRQARRCAGC